MGERALAVGANAQNELRLLQLATNETERALYVTDDRGCLLYINRAFTEIFGYTPEEALERDDLRLNR